MKIRDLKCRLATILIASLVLCHASFAGQFVMDNGVKRYIDDDGKLAVGWRWLDINNDGICECYRFDMTGALVMAKPEVATESEIATDSETENESEIATDSEVDEELEVSTESIISSISNPKKNKNKKPVITYKGKDINEEGQWVVNGIVQRVYKDTGRPLYALNANFGNEEDPNEYFKVGTNSTIRRLNATNKNIKEMIEADLNRDEEAYQKSLVGPKGVFEPPKEGYVLGNKVKISNERPTATTSEWGMIAEHLGEDPVRYLSATESVVAGRDMRNFVTASNKYTKEANDVKIYGGGVWDDVMVLQGNGAYVKFRTTATTGKFKANYFTVEIAHQTHGESTADTYCAIELYLNGKSIESYDEFCDGEPEKVEVWLEEGETNIELRAIVTGDAPGRKIYLKNARFRQIRERDDE